MSIRDLTHWSRDRKSPMTTGDYHPIQTLQDRVDRLFDDFFRGLDINPFAQTGAVDGWLTPRIDVKENDKEYAFVAELPGVEEKNVEVTLSDGVLTIKGDKNAETKADKDRFLRTERRYGAFQRSFPMPSDADQEKVKASYRNGVLTVTVGKSMTAKPATKRIQIGKAA